MLANACDWLSMPLPFAIPQSKREKEEEKKKIAQSSEFKV